MSLLWFLIKNLKFKLTKGDLRLRVVQGMIWGLIRFKAVEIQVPIVGRGLGQGVKPGARRWPGVEKRTNIF